MPLMDNSMKLHVQNAIWLVSLPSSAKQQRQMSIFQVLLRTWLRDAKVSLKNSDANNNSKTATYSKKVVSYSGERESGGKNSFSKPCPPRRQLVFFFFTFYGRRELTAVNLR